MPTRTPFTLTGSTTDADGDTLTYQWEQTDNGVGAGTSLVEQHQAQRTALPGLRHLRRRLRQARSSTTRRARTWRGPTRAGPSRTSCRSPRNTNAKTGTCPAPAARGTVPVTDPALNCFSEFLPTSAYVGTGTR